MYYIDLINKNIAPIDTLKSENHQSVICYSHTQIANFFLKNNDLEQAKKYIDLAKRNEEFGRGNILLAEGQYWLKKRDYNKTKLAIVAFEAINAQAFSAIEALLELKIDYYTAIKDFKQVIAIQKELLKTQKEKFGNDRLRFGTFANAEFNALEQQQQIAALENSSKLAKLQTRNRSYIAIIVFHNNYWLLLLFCGHRKSTKYKNPSLFR
ncbi:MAG: hypothetical protein HC803_04290 [Saprospiraceae bacterium]|nr:hypothetical protein [Saprospiraceae bacterium]